MSLSEAEALVADALRRAGQLGITVSAAVCDAGGNLVSFARMDGAEIAGTVLAPDKAFTSLSNRITTSELGRQAQPGGPLYGIAANFGGRMVTFGGGVPIYQEGQLIGGLGVSGGTPEEDEGCCIAGLSARGLAAKP